MIAFRDITPADRERVHAFTLGSRRRNCDLSFANLCSWRFLYGTQLAVRDNHLLFRFVADGHPAYMMPVGEGDMRPALQALTDDAADRGEPFRMFGVCTDAKEEMEAALPGRFRFRASRDYADYLYLRTDLATLKGKKFQAKRNHVNRFLKEYPDYEYCELTPERVPECLKLEEAWCRTADRSEQAALEAERRSMTFALSHIEELGLTGGILHAGGRIAAFTYGAPVNGDTWDVCVEKADTEVEGSYAMINCEYARRLDERYVYVNREEDLGLDGLRRAKLSYQPVALLEKWMAELR